MAKSKKQAITTEENVDLLNLEDKVSETPATLVAPSPDNSYEANSEDGSKLSPNPAGSGFTSQRLVDTLPETGLVNVLYIVPIKNAGENIVGYKKFRWDLETRSWLRVFGSIPALSLVDGGREQRAIVTNPNRDKPKVFNEKVVFNNEVYIGGRKVTGEDKEGTYVEGNPADDGNPHQELVRIQIGDEQFDIPTEQGTKLYKHSISFTNTSEVRNYDMQVISYSSELVNNPSKLVTLLQKALSTYDIQSEDASDPGPYIEHCFMGVEDNDVLWFDRFSANPSRTNIASNSISDVSDTVTEL